MVVFVFELAAKLPGRYYLYVNRFYEKVNKSAIVFTQC